jgi:hypothetical protein
MGIWSHTWLRRQIVKCIGVTPVSPEKTRDVLYKSIRLLGSGENEAGAVANTIDVCDSPSGSRED